MVSEKEIQNRIKKLNIVKRAKGDRYYARVSIQNYRKSIYGLTKQEVRVKAADYLRSLNEKITEDENECDESSVLLQDFMIDYLKTQKWNKIKRSSYTRLFRVYDCQIRNGIGLFPLKSVTTELVQQYIDEYAYNKDISKALSHSGLVRYKELISMTMNYAVKKQLLASNPCNDVVIPLKQYCTKKTREQFSLDDETIEEFKATALKKKGSEYLYQRNGLLLLLMLNLGLRVGELLALEWRDFDLRNNLVIISKTIEANVMDNPTDGTQYRDSLGTTKTWAGTRAIPLNDTILFLYRELIEYDKRNGIVCRTVADYDEMTKGRAQNLQRTLNRIFKNIDCEDHVTLHTLRHTFGSKLLRNNIDISVVSKLLGHSTIAVTYKSYIHVINKQKVQAMELISIS